MTDAALAALAEAAGVAPRWTDIHGQTHEVGPDTLRAVLLASGFPAGTDAEIADSHARLNAPSALPPLITGQVGVPTYIPGKRGDYTLLNT